MKNTLLPLLFIVLSAISSFSQNQSPTPDSNDDVVKISTNLIQVDVSVTDKDGKQIRDLKPEDFEVYENNESQKITNFSYVSVVSPEKPEATRAQNDSKNDVVKNLPPVPTKLKPNEVRRTIALVVDDLGIAFSGVAHVKDTLRKFVNRQMQPNDLVAVVRASGGALQQFTTDKRLLLVAIDKIKPNVNKISSFVPVTVTGGAAGDAGHLARSEAQYALGALGAMNFLIKSMENLPGRKTIILFSEGFILREKPGRPNTGAAQPTQNNNVEENLENKLFNDAVRENRQVYDEIGDASKILIESANRASVVINTIDARGLLEPSANADDGDFQANPGGGSFSPTAASIGEAVDKRKVKLFDTQTALIFLAEETGGRAFLNNNGFSDAVQKSVDDQNGYYLLGYEPDEKTFDPQKRKFNVFEVRVKNRPDLKVRYRSGFFGVTDTKFQSSSKIAGQELSEALFSPFDASEINLNLTPIYSDDVKTGKSVGAFLHIEGANLIFKKESDETRKGVFEVLGYTFDANGKAVDRIAKTYTLNLKETDYQKLQAKGLVYTINIPVKNSGAYQLKVAFRDTNSGKVGSASQFIEIPNLEKNRIALSGILLRNFTPEQWKAVQQGTAQAATASGLQTDTATRQFKSGTVLSFAYEIYSRNANANVLAQARIFHDERLVMEGKKEPLRTVGQKVQTGGALVLPGSFKPGNYVLQILVTDESAKEKNRISTQWIDFEVVN